MDDAWSQFATKAPSRMKVTVADGPGDARRRKLPLSLYWQDQRMMAMTNSRRKPVHSLFHPRHHDGPYPLLCRCVRAHGLLCWR